MQNQEINEPANQRTTGTLYLVATPIGNLEDMSFRAIRILGEVDYIAAEDTRHTIKLLNHFEISKRMVAYHDHNRKEKGSEIIRDLLAGKDVALVTDAGTPGISDPGEDLVKHCHEHGIKVTSVPGPAALINALILSGKDTRRFVFEGFLPMPKKDRRHRLESLKTETRTFILYEAPHKLKNTLSDLAKTLGEDRHITLTRELTKRYEEIQNLTLGEAIAYYRKKDPRGEYALVIQGLSEEVLLEQAQAKFHALSMEDHMEQYLKQGINKKEAIKQIAKDRGLPKREVYDYFNR